MKKIEVDIPKMARTVEISGVKINGKYYNGNKLSEHIGEEITLVVSVGFAYAYDKDNNFICTVEKVA